jgi:hypothetical protein
MSSNLFEIFAADARKYLDRLHEALAGEGGTNVDGIRRAARRLHHAAVLANHESAAYASSALQKMSVEVIAGRREWTDELSRAMREVVLELDSVVAALPEAGAEAERRLRKAADALRDEPLSVTPESAAPETDPDATTVEVDVGEAGAVLAALIGDLGDAVERLENDPRDREPLKAMLRKIRRLRELQQIEVLSPEDKALSAVEELILQIADLNATVGPGYLTVFRHAREVLEGMQPGGPETPSITRVGGRAVEVDRLKESVMEKVRRARQVVWVSDLFYPEGPHIQACPVATEQAGSPEGYFIKEATQRLERSENLRKTMLKSNTEQMRLAGESLANTLRHLRERAAAFNHMGMGRVVRRAAAALRAQLVRPPAQLKALATGFGPVFANLLAYVRTEERATRARAIADAEAALQLAIVGGRAEEAVVEVVEFDPDAALQQALALRTRIDERLRKLVGPDADGMRHDLEELFDLIAKYVSASAERH